MYSKYCGTPSPDAHCAVVDSLMMAKVMFAVAAEHAYRLSQPTTHEYVDESRSYDVNDQDLHELCGEHFVDPKDVMGPAADWIPLSSLRATYTTKATRT